jgi:DNA-binding NtrC family response regulator
VRELENVIERATTLDQGAGITANALPPKVLGREGQAEPPTADEPTGRLPGTPTIDELERQHLVHVLGLTAATAKVRRKSSASIAERSIAWLSGLALSSDMKCWNLPVFCSFEPSH